LVIAGQIQYFLLLHQRVVVVVLETTAQLRGKMEVLVEVVGGTLRQDQLLQVVLETLQTLPPHKEITVVMARPQQRLDMVVEAVAVHLLLV
jgi:hypothetical protein